MLKFLVVVGLCAIISRLSYWQGYRTASRRARQIAQLATVEAARVDVPIESCSVCGERGCPDHM